MNNIEIYKNQLKKIKEIELNYNIEENYNKLMEFISEFESITGNYELEETSIYQEIIDFEYLEEMTKKELEEGGLARLYYFLPDEFNPFCDSIFRIDGYGNAQNIETDDLILCKDEMIEKIENIIEEMEG